MLPQISSVQLVGSSGNRAHATALAAILRAFPDLKVRQARDLDDSLEGGAAGEPELLVLVNPQSGDIGRAAATLDRRGLSRWSIIARGTAPADSASPFIGVDEDDWNAPILAHTLKAATALHALERENARLRGDLRTLCRRYAHDMRSPLSGISTANDALREPSSGLAPAARRFTDSIADGIVESMKLIDRLNGILAATADPRPLDTVTMEEIIWGTLQRLETSVIAAGATVTKPRSWPAVGGVASWIDLIWLNLIANSLRYGGPKPQIKLGWERGAGEYRFWIRDSGRGVEPAKRDSLFHPFDRLGELNAPRGYGLPIVQRLVELQGGRCGYTPDPGPAGTFFFTLRETA